MDKWQQGKALYRSILRLHRQLIPQQRAIGDMYVKEEFRKHKNLAINSPFLESFTKEWNLYLIQLQQEIQSINNRNKKKGIKPNTQDLEKFSHEQIDTLFDLYQETQKPKLPN